MDNIVNTNHRIGKFLEDDYERSQDEPKEYERNRNKDDEFEFSKDVLDVTCL